MNTFPKVSVVTTTYNDIENLKRILAEVKKQTYPNIEHIIVDGGSTDGTVDLLKELEDETGTGYEMAGVFSGKGYKKGKNSHFGYITVQTEKDSLYLKAGETIKGHEFHYWESTQDENELKMQAKKPTGKRSWPCVTVKNQVMAGFPHLYYPSQEGFGERFVQACDRYRMKRKRQQ